MTKEARWGDVCIRFAPWPASGVGKSTAGGRLGCVVAGMDDISEYIMDLSTIALNETGIRLECHPVSVSSKIATESQAIGLLLNPDAF